MAWFTYWSYTRTLVASGLKSSSLLSSTVKNPFQSDGIRVDSKTFLLRTLSSLLPRHYLQRIIFVDVPHNVKPLDFLKLPQHVGRNYRVEVLFKSAYSCELEHRLQQLHQELLHPHSVAPLSDWRHLTSISQGLL